MIKKAVIVAAGLGTRFLPITKTFPKEMLPLVDKPVLQYIIEEAAQSGIKEIILVISPDKKAIKDYFRPNKKLEFFLRVRKKLSWLAEVKAINRLPKIVYRYQKKPLGIADAILKARDRVENEPFALFFADDVVSSKIPCLKQLIKIYQRYKNIVVAVTPVPRKDVFHYGIIKGKKISSDTYKIEDLIEKPKIKEAPSNLAIVGRYILTPPIFKIIERLARAGIKAGEEIYLTDALKIYLQENSPFYACQYEGEWLSCGNKIGWLKANIKIGLKHPETKKELKKYLKESREYSQISHE